jgi:hypothetical protein
MSRTVERRRGYDNWEPVLFMELTRGDIFRMYEQNGEPVIDQKGRKEWIAAGKPYINKDGIPAIMIYNS